MPFIVIRKNAAKGSAGDGGNCGVEKYLEMVLGPPRFVAYTLPKDILIKRVVVNSEIDQTCSIIGIKADNSSFDIVPVSDFITARKETFAPNTHHDVAFVIDSLDASPEANLLVTITYQDFTI